MVFLQSPQERTEALETLDRAVATGYDHLDQIKKTWRSNRCVATRILKLSSNKYKNAATIGP